MTAIPEPEQITIANEIPAVIWRGAGPPPRPAIIWLQGGLQTKWDVDNHVVQRVPASGVTIVSIDMHLHGERTPPGFEWKVPVPLADVFISIERTARDIFTVVEYLQQDPAVDANHIGLRGYSHSAHIVTLAMGMGAPVTACLSVAGGGDLTAGLTVFMHRQGTSRADAAAQLRELETELVRANPLYHVDRFAPKPIMMVHGLHDTQADFAAQFALYQALIPYYQDHPGDCLFLAHADGHAPPPYIEEFALSWLVRQVGATLSPGSAD